MARISSDNCVVCSEEFLLNEFNSLISTKSYKVCQACLNVSDPANDYEQVRIIIRGYLKFSQQTLDPELASPDIKIEPMESSIHKAVELLKKVNPSYFIGVRKIVVDTGSGFGHVSAGPGQDPTIIHINLPKIRSEIQNKLGASSKEAQEREFIRQIALTISHERKHQSTYTPEAGFAPETAAEEEERSISDKIDNYYKELL